MCKKKRQNYQSTHHEKFGTENIKHINYYSWPYCRIFLTCREEAKDCPQIVVADIDTSPFLQKQTVKIKEVSTTYRYHMLILNMLNAYNEQFGYVVT